MSVVRTSPEKTVVLSTQERATETINVRLKPSELADIDRVRGQEPRAAFIKRYMAAVVKRLDEVGGPDG